MIRSTRCAAPFSFSYNISKPYPFKWFAPAAITVLVVFATLLTFLNFLSTGYILHSEISSNPNATELEDAQLRRWPSFIFNTRPTCQATNLPVGTQFFTNQTGLTYTLKAVWTQNGTGTHVLSSIPYFNNVLEDCTVTSIDIDIEGDDRNSAQIGFNAYGETVRSRIRCSIQSPTGKIMFNLIQEYDYVPPDISMAFLEIGEAFLGTNFLERDNQTRASMWWGESLMSTYWGTVSGELQIIRGNLPIGESPIRKGAMYFAPRNILDIARSDFFKLDFRFNNENREEVYPGMYDFDITRDSISVLSDMEAYPNVWASADILAKSTYSTILTDLGQTDAKPNIVTDPVTLQIYTAIFPDPPFHANAFPGPAREDYNTLKDFMGPLGTTPSVINTEYICQVPKRKSTSNLVVSILVADLVFLQAIWTVFKLAVDFFALRKHPGAQFCQGCMSQMGAVLGSHDNINDAETTKQWTNGTVLKRLDSITSVRRLSLGQNYANERGSFSREAFQPLVSRS